MVKFNEKLILSSISVIILIVIIFQVYSSTVPLAQTSGNSLNDSNRCEATGCIYNSTMSDPCRNNLSQESTVCAFTSVPLSGLFGGGGVVFLVIMASLFIMIVASVFKGKK